MKRHYNVFKGSSYLKFLLKNKDENVHNYEVNGEKKIKGKVKEREKKERERKIDRETERII